MIIKMKHDVSQEDINRTVDRLESVARDSGVVVSHIVSKGEELPVVAVQAKGTDIAKMDLDQIRQLESVDSIVRIAEPYKLASKTYKEKRILDVSGVQVGNGRLLIIAGPCGVESEEQIMQAAIGSKEAGADMLRAGAYKPRTSPYSFQGLKKYGLKLLAQAKEETGLPIVTEITDPRNIDLYLDNGIDVFQVGTRNGQNYDLLIALTDALKGTDKAVLLKRGMGATLDEFIQAGEYLLAGDVQNVMLCLRGIKGIDTKHTRNSVDTADISVLRTLCNLPVVYDPSHSTGDRDLVYPVTLGAIGHGADGIVVEAHPNPEMAKSDGPQSLYLNKKERDRTNLVTLIESARHTYQAIKHIR